MMKRNHSVFIRWQGIILALALVLYSLLEPAYCQHTSRPFAEWQPRTDATALLLQQSSPQAGTVTPEAGVHYFDLNSEVTLTAVPKPGYYFVYWMGDVSDPTANSTVVYLDAPKIVIAVFERSEYESLLEKELQNTLGGGERMYLSSADYSNQSYEGGGGAGSVSVPRARVLPSPLPLEPSPEPEEEEPEPDEFPVPHAPEPATLVLFGTAGIWIFTRKRRPA
jgi:hypothetical protein